MMTNNNRCRYGQKSHNGQNGLKGKIAEMVELVKVAEISEKAIITIRLKLYING